MFKKILLIIISLFLCIPLFSQYTIIKYKSDFPVFYYEMKSGELTNPKIEPEMQDYYIYVYKDKRAISYYYRSIHKHSNTMLLDLFDRKKSKTISLNVSQSEHSGKIYITTWARQNWMDINPTKKPYVDDLLQSYIDKALADKDSVPQWKAPEIIYTDSTRTIGKYNCKNAMVKANNDVLSVWYTQDINYSWCFSDFWFLIPGTVVLQEKNGKLDFVLEEISETNSIDPKLKEAFKYKRVKNK